MDMGNKKKDIDDMLLNYSDDMYVIPNVDKSKFMDVYGEKKNRKPAVSISLAPVALIIIAVVAVKFVINKPPVVDEPMQTSVKEDVDIPTDSAYIMHDDGTVEIIDSHILTDEEFAPMEKILRDKVKNANWSEEKTQQLIDIYREQPAYVFDGIENLPELCVNEYGQTYGLDALYPDLVAACADNGKSGYVYREELYPDVSNEGLKTAEEIEALSHQHTVLNVYASDGRTIIGQFTFGAEFDE